MRIFYKEEERRLREGASTMLLPLVVRPLTLSSLSLIGGVNGEVSAGSADEREVRRVMPGIARGIRGLLCLILLILFSITQTDAQRTRTSFSIFGGPAYTLFRPTELLPEGFEISQRFNPNFGLLFNIEHDSAFAFRLGAGYMTKAYFFNHYLGENRDAKVMLNQKIEAFHFAADLLYNIDAGKYKIRPIIGGTYSINRNNGGDVQVPDGAMQYLIDPPPIVDVQNEVVINSFGLRGGVGVRPKSFYAFEVSLLYGYEFQTFPGNTYAVTEITPSGTVDHSVSWQGKMSYITLMLIIHLGSLV